VRVARQRDGIGEQYAVLLGPVERPRLLVEVSWRHHYCAVWLFDGLLRRTLKFDFRRLTEERMFLNQTREWRYATAEQREFDDAAWTRTCRFSTDGQGEEQIQPAGGRGGLHVRWHQVPVEKLWHPVPSFGDWALLAGVDPDVPPSLLLIERPDPDGGTDTRGGVTTAASPPGEQRPWRPPVPLQPSRLDALFQSGTRYAMATGDPVVVEVRRAGLLHMPSGRLIMADPALLDAQVEPFTIAIPPGTYPVILAVIRFEQQPTHERVAAAKLVVRKEPVVSWELALRPGEDPRLLGDGEFFGFGVDTGTASLLDAAALSAMVGLVTDDAWEAFIDRHGDDLGRRKPVETLDPGSGANLIAFESGWGDGSYPTWIGRTAAGEAACFVADMLVVHAATILP
jgi:Protein of unknown function (DUF4241)